MFVVDTNVLSELRVPQRANPNVVNWLDNTFISSLFITATILMELEIGALQKARRDERQGSMLRNWIDKKILPQFDGRILPFDAAVALRCAALHVPDRRPERDAIIGATALVHGFTIVTRNVADFAPMGVRLLNPWEAER